MTSSGSWVRFISVWRERVIDWLDVLAIIDPQYYDKKWSWNLTIHLCQYEKFVDMTLVYHEASIFDQMSSFAEKQGHKYKISMLQSFEKLKTFSPQFFILFFLNHTILILCIKLHTSSILYRIHETFEVIIFLVHS